MRCMVCGSNSFTHLFIARNYSFIAFSYKLAKYFSIIQCDKCKLLITYPFPSKRASKKYYPKEYYKEHETTNRILKFLGKFINFLARGAPNFIGDIPLIKPFGFRKVLDVGCGNGYMLSEFKKAGWLNEFGIDFSTSAIKICKKLGLNVRMSSIEKFRTNKKFDLVILSHVLEHLKNPKKILRHINSMLKKDGLLIVAVPNTRCIEFKLFKKYWFDLDVPRHIFHFSTINLSFLLKKCKYKIIKVYTNPYLHFFVYLDFFLRGKKFYRYSKFSTFLSYIFFGILGILLARLNVGYTVTVVGKKL